MFSISWRLNERTRREKSVKSEDRPLNDAYDLYNTKPTGTMSWEGHQHQYEGARNRLNRLVQDYYSSGCKGPLPPGFGQWAMRPAPPAPWWVGKPGVYGPPSLSVIAIPNPAPIGSMQGTPLTSGGITAGQAGAVGLTGGAIYFGYRCLRMIPSLYPPLWETIPLNAATP